MGIKYRLLGYIYIYSFLYFIIVWCAYNVCLFVNLSFKRAKKFLKLFRRDFFSLHLILLIYLICGFAFVTFLMLFYLECWQKYHNKILI